MRISDDDVIKCGKHSEFNPIPFTYDEVWRRATTHYGISYVHVQEYMRIHPSTKHSQESIALCKVMSHILKDRARINDERSTSKCLKSNVVTEAELSNNKFSKKYSELWFNATNRYEARDVSRACRVPDNIMNLHRRT
jgi:hypothetical protein